MEILICFDLPNVLIYHFHMDTRLEPLFTPWKIGKCEIKNRIVLTSMGGTDLFGWMEKNHFDKDGARFIMEVAENNVGLLLPGCQPIYNPMFGQWLHKNKKMYKDLGAWMPSFHKSGAKLFVQLTAGFGRSFTISSMMEMLYNTPIIRTISKPIMNLDRITASASPSPNRWSDKVPSRQMTKDEIKEMVFSFAESALMLRDAGVDGVEIHAVHEGYLLDQFTLKYVNKRNDEYGGSIENRMRFPLEVARAVRAAVGETFPVFVKINSSDGVEGGMSEDESLQVSEALAAYVDAIEVSGTTYGKVKIAGPDGQHGLYASYAAALAERVDIPVMLTGGNRLCAEMQELLDSTGIAGFGLARPLVSEPDLIAHWERDAGYEPRCVSCSRCFPGPGKNCVFDRP